MLLIVCVKSSSFDSLQNSSFHYFLLSILSIIITDIIAVLTLIYFLFLQVLQICDQLYLAHKITENQLLYLRHLVLIREEVRTYVRYMVFNFLLK